MKAAFIHLGHRGLWTVGPPLTLDLEGKVRSVPRSTKLVGRQSSGSGRKVRREVDWRRWTDQSSHSYLGLTVHPKEWRNPRRATVPHRLTLDLWLAKDNRFLNPKSSYKRIRKRWFKNLRTTISKNKKRY